MSRGRAFQSSGAAYVKERSPRVTLDNFLGQLRMRLSQELLRLYRGGDLMEINEATYVGAKPLRALNVHNVSNNLTINIRSGIKRIEQCVGLFVLEDRFY